MEGQYVETKYDEVVDQIEAKIISDLPPVECPIRHYFTPGLYCREMFVPAGTILTSKCHKTEHPFIVSKGCVSVIKQEKVEAFIEAPYFGITYPNTRRVIYAHEDTIWTTIHATDIKPESDSEEDILKAALKIEEQIIYPHENKCIGNKEMEEIE